MMLLPSHIIVFNNSIPISTIFWFLGLAASLLLCFFHSRVRGFKVIEMFKIALVGFLGALIGGRLGHVFQYWNHFLEYPVEVFYLHQGGMMYLAGLYGGLLAGVFYVRRRYDVLQILDLAAPSICLGHFFGRLGCFFYGCCYGIGVSVENSYLGYQFFGDDILRYPTQLFSAFGLLILTLILSWLYSKSLRKGSVFLTYLFLYSLMRFGVEFLRADERGVLFGIESLSPSQILSIGTIFLLIILIPSWIKGTSKTF